MRGAGSKKRPVIANAVVRETSADYVQIYIGSVWMSRRIYRQLTGNNAPRNRERRVKFQIVYSTQKGETR